MSGSAAVLTQVRPGVIHSEKWGASDEGTKEMCPRRCPACNKLLGKTDMTPGSRCDLWCSKCKRSWVFEQA